MKVRVTNIQRFSLHDGPGIRTTIFMKGCSLKCPWCANPENINFDIERYFDKDIKEICFFGYDISLDKLEKEIMNDIEFYKRNNGGVTFSGGEPLLQFNKLEPLLISLKSQGINLCIESSLFVPISCLEIAIKYIDEFYVDVKILEPLLCKKIVGGNIDIYYNNLDLLFSKIDNSRIVFRIPVTYEYLLKERNLKLLEKLLKKYTPSKVELFKIHSLGEKKYDVLNIKMTKYREVLDTDITKLKNLILSLNINAEICKI